MYADKNLPGHFSDYPFDTYNHVGFSLRDAQIMRSWLAYAAMIGDLSYLEISRSAVQQFPIEKLPPFEPVADE